MTRLWGLRWWMIGLLMAASVVNYLTRSALGVAAPTVLKDLEITTQQYSWILSGFQLASTFWGFRWAPAEKVIHALSPFEIVNTYGLLVVGQYDFHREN